MTTLRRLGSVLAIALVAAVLAGAPLAAAPFPAPAPLAASAPAAANRPGGELAVRYALVVGNRGEEELPDFGKVVSDELMADYLTQWDPHSDNPEILRLFALRGLSEVSRQAARLPAGGGQLAGGVRVGDDAWRIELDVRREGGNYRVGAQISRNGELLSAPTVINYLGSKAIVSAGSEDGTFMFLVLQAEEWKAPTLAARPAGAGSPAGAEPPLPRVVEKAAVVYPESEKPSRRQGIVVVALDVDTQGRVSGARVARSLAPAFDEAALDSVRRWRFEPARVDGRAVASSMNITINFHP